LNDIPSFQINNSIIQTSKIKNMSTLKEGDKAPNFTAKDQNGKTVSLSDFKGKTVILYFYPKDDTPGCTAEACDFRDNYQSLLSKGFQVIGVSIDSEKSHKKFETKYSLPFPLIADEDKKIVEAYGLWVEKSMYGKTYMGTARTTFIIDGAGVIKKVIDKVDTKNASQQVLDVVG
jgi:thioredoxin-dependent peroxiredoxin